MSKQNLSPVVGASSRRSSQSSITIQSWEGVLVLVREPDRHGESALFIRLVLGDMPPKRYGPFPSMKEAQACFTEMIDDYLESGLSDLSDNMGTASSNHGASGLYSTEH